MFNIVLIEPEIPQNTGNIGRLCIGLRGRLHVVGKLGFSLDDKQLKRAGLDYWPHLEFYHHPTWEEWMKMVADKGRVFYFSTKVDRPYYQIEFQEEDWLVFGKETKGLDGSILKTHPQQTVTIPFSGSIRSFNLANAVAMSLGEARRQQP